MKVEDLQDLFDEYPDFSGFEFAGVCQDCGSGTVTTIDLTDDGFKVDGWLCRGDDGKDYLKCPECAKKNDRLTHYRECEVYSRVVGYLRPIKQWNQGKRAEFAKRSLYKI